MSANTVVNTGGSMHGDMDFGFWRQNVIDAARRAADRTYQQRAWFGQGPEVDSPGELICTFMGDLVFEEFLIHLRLSQPERAEAVRLYEAVERYASLSPETLNPFHVIDDPQFESVRIGAKEF
jgi:hypothetical protein